MSKLTTADITCQNCGKSFEKEIYTSVNSKLDPVLREKILDGEFFKHRCDYCDYVNDIFYEVLYHDMTNNFMVWLVKPDNENIIFMQQNSLKMVTMLSDYRLFIARYPFQWIERIITAENDLDARVIELYKFGLKQKIGFPLQTQNDFLHYQKSKKNLLGLTKFYWTYVHDNGDIDKFSKKVDAEMYKGYENLITSLEPNLSPSTWYLIDWQFPFGKEINDGELIQLPIKSEIVEIGETKTKFPAQFLDVVKRTGMGEKL